MKLKRRYQAYLIAPIAVLVFIFSPWKAQAQQEPMYSQYMFNGLVLNPAYAGSHDAISLSALVRRQWTGLDGSPQTETFSAHMPIGLGLSGGLNFVHDQIGVTNRYFVSTAFSYSIPVGLGRLSFGLKTGFINYRTDFSKLTIQNPNDFVYGGEQVVNDLMPDFGAGIYYYSDRFFAGISVPTLMNESINTSEGMSINDLKKHYFLYSGYLFTLTESFKLKPNVLVKMVEGAPVQLDVNANLYFKETIGVGLSYRSFDSFTAIFEYQFNPQLGMGYSYDFWTTTDLRNVQYGSHEIMINYRFSFNKNILLTPRYF